ncbi:ATP-binding response regulator [Shewanella acanthi]|uniref:ATP-binding response regulator n=1 Tax=Shewanella acanthi TaxID=2864212 RepID=UPI001C65741A|nr:response regulator [Shewanella acanthi]QYJ79214.1 response regulator [Shewanella acanthi]
MELTHLQVLVVEDVDSLRKIIAEQLRQMGFGQVLQADSGKQAQEILRNNAVDLMLLDWSMPEGHGQELLDHLRLQEKWQQLPVVLVTANTHRSLVQVAIQYGVLDIIAKPFNAKTLQSRVIQALASHRAKLEAASSSEVSNQLEMSGQDAPLDNAQCVILIVDDLLENLVLMAGLLGDDYQVLQAQDGQSALNYCLSDTPPDLVLLDVMMPGMDGHQVFKRMREHPKASQIPVIFISALDDVDQQLLGLRFGACDYLVKPVQADILKQKIANSLARRRQQNRIKQQHEEIKQYLEQRDSADSIITHDLKGPLATISALAQKFAQEASFPKEWLSEINLVDELALQSIQTINLASDILLIEAGEYEVEAEWFSVLELMEKLAALMQRTFTNKHLAVTFTPEEDISSTFDLMAEPRLCHPLFFNLLKNAFEAAPPHTNIAIRFSREAQLVVIHIENLGKIPESIRERFWEKYATEGKRDGTGIGTYAARLFARAQGGDTRLKVDEAKGMTLVEVRLPAAIDMDV